MLDNARFGIVGRGEIMDARITVDGEAGEGYRELVEWLRCEPELRGRVQEIRRPSGTEAMGLPIELVVSGLGSGALTVVARSVRTWLEHRRSDVEIEVETDRGRVTLSVTDAKDPEGLLRKLADIIADPPAN
jgi:hypothetical protein